MKFTKEQQDYIKHCGEHFEVLTGGRGHSKTKEVIEDMQQEINRLNNIINELEKWLVNWSEMLDCPDFYEEGIIDCINDTLNKLQELKGGDYIDNN